jgi:hypothetical protein
VRSRTRQDPSPVTHLTVLQRRHDIKVLNEVKVVGRHEHGGGEFAARGTREGERGQTLANGGQHLRILRTKSRSKPRHNSHSSESSVPSYHQSCLQLRSGVAYVRACCISDAGAPCSPWHCTPLHTTPPSAVAQLRLLRLCKARSANPDIYTPPPPRGWFLASCHSGLQSMMHDATDKKLQLRRSGTIQYATSSSSSKSEPRNTAERRGICTVDMRRGAKRGSWAERGGTTWAARSSLALCPLRWASRGAYLRGQRLVHEDDGRATAHSARQHQALP